MKIEIIKNMPHEEYLALKRFSYSGIKQILTSSQNYWVNSFMNEKRAGKKSDALVLGTAYHTFVLEGEDIFNSRYVIKPDVDKRTKEGKAVYAEIEEKFPNCKFISQEDHNNIKSSLASKSNIFTNGDAEVTVLWDDEETGVPMKARLDYLTDTSILDLKTFSNQYNDNINKLVARHIFSYSYHIQRALYGDLEPFKDLDFRFVFQQADGYNNCVEVNLPSNLLIVQKGRDLVRKGIRKFAENYRKYGTDEWIDGKETLVATDEFFPLYIYE